MIPEIGLIIGLYIITRMVSFLLRTGDRKESVAVMVLAVINIIVTGFVIYDFFVTGASIQIKKTS